MSSMNWLKIKDDLHEEPEVLEMARQLQTRPEHVAGYCLKFWGWVSRNCHDGVVTNVTLESVESVLNMPNFLSMMCRVGWLDFIESANGCQIIIPNFERHLSQGAKQRALDARRQSNKRRRERENGVTKTSRNDRDTCVTREEKRRESNKEPLSPLACAKGDGLKIVLSAWKKRHPKSRASDLVKRRIRERLADGYTAEELVTAIETADLSRTARSIFRSSDPIDQLLAKAREGQDRRRPTFEQFRSAIIKTARSEGVDPPSEAMIEEMFANQKNSLARN